MPRPDPTPHAALRLSHSLSQQPAVSRTPAETALVDLGAAYVALRDRHNALVRDVAKALEAARG